MKGRLVECLETVLNKAQEPPKSKKVQHSNAKNAILFETISLIIHYDRCCGQRWGQSGATGLWKGGWHLTLGSEGQQGLGRGQCEMVPSDDAKSLHILSVNPAY